jgi:hypothetical protein
VFVTNHALSGVLIGRALRGRPLAAFVVGVGSHLVLDSLPHWKCAEDQPDRAAHFLRVAKRDGLLGLATMAAATVSVDKSARAATVAAMTGAVLLDLDKPLVQYFCWNPFPLAVQRFHNWVQCESPRGLRNEFVFGFAMTAADALSVVLGRREVHRVGVTG